MTSSWDTYYIVFLSGALSLGIPVGLAMISFVFFSTSRVKKTNESLKSVSFKPNRTILGQRINVRFFLAANAALVLITLILSLIPCVTILQEQNQEGLIMGLVSIVTIAGFAALGLLYSVRKGDMGWLNTYNNAENVLSKGFHKKED